MDYVLLDIKNFLKKLENGQLEIEAGQWELHKDLANMKLEMAEIKNIKEDLEKMRINSLQQMTLIKALQTKIDTFNQAPAEDTPLTISERSITYEKVYRRPPNEMSPPQGYKKRKSHVIRSEEIIEITSQISNEKSESNQEKSATETEESSFKISEKKENPRDDSGSDESLYLDFSHITPSQTKSNEYSCTANNDILQRYLKDSAKYVDNKSTESSDLTYRTSELRNTEKPNSEIKYTPFWDDYESRTQKNAGYGKENSAKTKPAESVRTAESIMLKRLVCSKCPRKFLYKSDLLRHKKEHQRAEAMRYCKVCGKGFSDKHQLKNHEAIHKVSSRASKGYKCSYCSKICSTPEILTSHLRKCRVIMRRHFKRK